MKQVYINNEPTFFWIDENGNLMNQKTGHYLKGTIRGGYKYYDLRFNHKKYTKSAHRLVAESFIPNPNNYPVVRHIDGNKLNNNINNLEWAINTSYANKSSNLIQTTDDVRRIMIAYCDAMAAQQWIPYKDTIYAVSDTGQVKNTKTNKILKGKITNMGYLEYCLRINKKKVSMLAHRLVYSAFYPYDELLTINHIDGNKLNNNIKNLENTSQLDNNIKSIYETRSKKFRMVGQYDAEGNLIQTFITCAQAAKYVGCKPQSINYAIHNNTCSCGYYWKYL